MTQLEIFRRQCAILWHKVMQLSRVDIFGSDSELVPLYMDNDNRIPQPGIVGPKYEPGGVVLLGVNPGGGRDTYQDRNDGDRVFYPALHAFRNANTKETVITGFEGVVKAWLRAQRQNLWPYNRLVQEALGATYLSVDEIVHHNVAPFRTRNDKLPNWNSLKRAFELMLRPQLNLLQPNTIISLGAGARDVVKKLYLPEIDKGHVRHYYVRRTYSNPHREGREVLEQIARDFKAARNS